MTLDDSPAADHQPRRIEPQGAKRIGRFRHEHALVGTARPGEIAQALDGMHDRNLPEVGSARIGALPFHPVARTVALDLNLTALSGEQRPLSEWLTTFHLASVVLDPYTNESSWILSTAERVLDAFRGADVRVNLVVTCGPDEAKQFLGPLVDRFLVYCDADRSFVRGLGLENLPAFVFVQGNGTVVDAAEGWDPADWRRVAKTIATTTAWLPPTIPVSGDPSPFHGTPAQG